MISSMQYHDSSPYQHTQYMDSHQAQHQHHLSPLDTLAHTSSYAALQLHQNRHVLPNGKEMMKTHGMAYANGPLAAAPRSQRDAILHERSGRGSTTSGPVRRRISRACDQCNQLRTKCDGKSPCAHCLEFGLTCEYVRERKKRGKASRKDIAQQQQQQQQAAQAAAVTNASGSGIEIASGTTAPPALSSSASPQSRTHGFIEDQNMAVESSQHGLEQPEGQRPLPHLSPPSLPLPGRSASMATTRGMDSMSMYQNVAPMSRTMSLGALDAMPENSVHQMVPSDGIHPMQPPRIQTQGLPLQNHIPEYASMDDFTGSMMHHSPRPMMQNSMHPIIPSNGMTEYADSPYSIMSPQSAHVPPNAFRMPAAESPMPGFIGNSSVPGSPGWLSLPPPSTAMYTSAPHSNAPQQLRYPVLQPLISHLTNIMPISLACDLLEMYFQTSSSAFVQPVSSYVLGYVFRKHSFLRQDSPRLCSPALLASMLWIGCLTSESPYLASSPSARSQLSEKLINLTISLLKPLVHQSTSETVSPTYNNSIASGVSLGGFGMSSQDFETGLPGGVDDVATYMHLAIVISASEYKAASLRWWNAAWSLARELKLGKEVPSTPPPEHDDDDDAPGEVDLEHMGGTHPNGQKTPVHFTEEQREERRRIWWLLYTEDRHLALCYNRPLSLLDLECDGLLQPVDEPLWQAGDFYQGDSAQYSSDDPNSPYSRRRGPSCEVSGHSIFGFFLPLMTILGEIVDLKHARNHPRFGTFKSWDDHAAEIVRQLEAYDESLQDLKIRAANEANAEAHEPMHPGPPSARPINSSSSRVPELVMRAKIAVTYGTYMMHTLHILLNGKWDPILLLDDNDLWISSQSFIDATGHAVSAAETLSTILEYDPDLSMIPFFFGIYLLQGSFPLLLIADKLQGEANPNIVKACETIVRAHEACITTLNTEYQRNFCKVMRSALQQVRGRDADFAQQRRRETLSLYRWSGDGTGLAL